MQNGDGALKGTIRDVFPISQGHCAGTYNLWIHQPEMKANGTRLNGRQEGDASSTAGQLETN